MTENEIEDINDAALLLGTNVRVFESIAKDADELAVPDMAEWLRRVAGDNKKSAAALTAILRKNPDWP